MILVIIIIVVVVVVVIIKNNYNSQGNASAICIERADFTQTPVASRSVWMWRLTFSLFFVKGFACQGVLFAPVHVDSRQSKRRRVPGEAREVHCCAGYLRFWGELSCDRIRPTMGKKADFSAEGVRHRESATEKCDYGFRVWWKTYSGLVRTFSSPIIPSAATGCSRRLYPQDVFSSPFHRALGG